MPIYDYECPECKKTGEHITGMNENKICDCGTEMTRQLHGRYGINMGPCGAYGYFDENLGKYISTNAERKYEMARQGVTERGGTPKLNQGAWV